MSVKTSPRARSSFCDRVEPLGVGRLIERAHIGEEVTKRGDGGVAGRRGGPRGGATVAAQPELTRVTSATARMNVSGITGLKRRASCVRPTTIRAPELFEGRGS